MNVIYTNVDDLDPQWNLPIDIRPADERAGSPIGNLFGLYTEATHLTTAMTLWRFNEAGDFKCDIPLGSSLLAAVQTEFNGTRIKLVPTNTNDTRSLAQSIPTLNSSGSDIAIEERRNNMIAQYGLDVYQDR